MGAALSSFAESLGEGAVDIAFGLSLGEIVSLVGAALAPARLFLLLDLLKIAARRRGQRYPCRDT